MKGKMDLLRYVYVHPLPMYLHFFLLLSYKLSLSFESERYCQRGLKNGPEHKSVGQREGERKRQMKKSLKKMVKSNKSLFDSCYL